MPAAGGSGGVPSPSLPSDADRERIVELLARHQAAGRFELAELERRVELVYAADSHEQLHAVIGDLPPLGPGQPPRPAGRGRGHAESEQPEAGWRPTGERFRDPRTRRILRVWVDPANGARHYVPDETG
jgi:hypothetical protein